MTEPNQAWTSWTLEALSLISKGPIILFLFLFCFFVWEGGKGGAMYMLICILREIEGEGR